MKEGHKTRREVSVYLDSLVENGTELKAEAYGQGKPVRIIGKLISYDENGYLFEGKREWGRNQPKKGRGNDKTYFVPRNNLLHLENMITDELAFGSGEGKTETLSYARESVIEFDNLSGFISVNGERLKRANGRPMSIKGAGAVLIARLTDTENYSVSKNELESQGPFGEEGISISTTMAHLNRKLLRYGINVRSIEDKVVLVTGEPELGNRSIPDPSFLLSEGLLGLDTEKGHIYARDQKLKKPDGEPIQIRGAGLAIMEELIKGRNYQIAASELSSRFEHGASAVATGVMHLNKKLEDFGLKIYSDADLLKLKELEE
jgi:hypothetical protein